MPTAVITGASRGLGRALAGALAFDGWSLDIDARGSTELERAARELGRMAPVVALAGDVMRSSHRRELIEAAGGRIHPLGNNASVLGPSPQPALAHYPPAEPGPVYPVNAPAPPPRLQPPP